jgi:pilus assembly protein FimV
MLEWIAGRMLLRMQRFPTSFALILALGLGADEATALGFGKVVATPILGQALSFAIRLRLAPTDSIEVKCIKTVVSPGERELPDAWVRHTPRFEPAAQDVPSHAALAASPGASAPRSDEKLRTGASEPAQPSSGPVLKPDAADLDGLISPSLQMATSLSRVPEPAASGVVPRLVASERDERVLDQQRLEAMEAALLELRSGSQATEKALADMQLRMRAAEARQYANPLVYLLVALCAVLATGLAAMAWLRYRYWGAAGWWAAQVEATPPPAPSGDETMAPLSELESVPGPAVRPADAAQVNPPVPALRHLPNASDPDASAPEPRRPMSAEELIDLEQQAEFFVVLGQDDAAIDLLMGHVRSTGGVSPLPYLKLLEIYRRRGEREPYDRIRERFNRRFNAYAPEWDVDPEQGLSLEDYPEVMSRLQKAWNAHSQAMDLLDASLFRRDAGPTFDVPAYRELLFLYGMARDLAEHDVAPDGVDLLLPLDEEPTSTLTSVQASPPVSTTSPLMSPMVEKFSLDLDVSSDPPPQLSLEDRDFKRSSR